MKCNAAAFASAASIIRDFDLEDLRRNFGVVLQDPHLFTGTIADNIRLGTEGISDERLIEAAEQVNLLDFIRDAAGALCATGARARRGTFHRAKAAHQFRARAGAQSALPDSGRSHLQRRYRNRAAHSRRSGAPGGRPHLDRHRAPALHHPARRPHSGDAQRQAARDGDAPGIAGAARRLLEAVSAPVQGPGTGASTRAPEAVTGD